MASARSAGSTGPSPEQVEQDLRASATEQGRLLRLKEAGLPVRSPPQGEPSGAHRVHSVEPTCGDPQLLSVWGEGDLQPWWIDRRSMRANREPASSSVAEPDAVTAADLADRAQLELGLPVTLRCFREGTETFVAGVEPLQPRVEFTNASYRRTSPLMSSRGTLCPFSVGMLDSALRLDGDGTQNPRVRRLFAQAYRRIDEQHTPWPSGGGGLARTLGRAGRVVADLAFPTADVARYRRSLAQLGPRYDAEDLSRLDTEDLLDSLRDRVESVITALALLERSRLATLSLLPAFQALAGEVPRDVFRALAEPIAPPTRNAVNDRLVALALALRVADGGLRVPAASDAPSLVEAWKRARRTLGRVRILGMDVRPAAAGSSDSALLEAVRGAWALHGAAPQERRRDAERRIREHASRPALAQALLLAMRRLARAKGVVAEGLSQSLLRVREAVLQTGERLEADGILDRSEDAFYLLPEDLEQALRGELGAYAAQSRYRREDDLRWRAYDAPRRIGRRPVVAARP